LLRRAPDGRGDHHAAQGRAQLPGLPRDLSFPRQLPRRAPGSLFGAALLDGRRPLRQAAQYRPLAGRRHGGAAQPRAARSHRLDEAHPMKRTLTLLALTCSLLLALAPPAAAQSVSAGRFFSQGHTDLMVTAGTGYALDRSYLVLGVGAAYYLLDG